MRTTQRQRRQPWQAPAWLDAGSCEVGRTPGKQPKQCQRFIIGKRQRAWFVFGFPVPCVGVPIKLACGVNGKMTQGGLVHANDGTKRP